MNDLPLLLKYGRELLTSHVSDLPFYAEDPIPIEVATTYARLLAAQTIGQEFSGNPFAEAILIRSTLASDDDDRVRVEALQQLLDTSSTHAESVMLALLLDSDEELRLAAWRAWLF
jgi:hypothetical protein